MHTVKRKDQSCIFGCSTLHKQLCKSRTRSYQVVTSHTANINMCATSQKWHLTSSGIDPMCVKVVAQPNGFLFHNSHFQDTMVCFYHLITSLTELLEGVAAHSCSVLPFTQASCSVQTERGSNISVQSDVFFCFLHKLSRFHREVEQPLMQAQNNMFSNLL